MGPFHHAPAVSLLCLVRGGGEVGFGLDISLIFDYMCHVFHYQGDFISMLEVLLEA